MKASTSDVLYTYHFFIILNFSLLTMAIVYPYPVTHYKTHSEKLAVETFVDSLSNRYTIFYDRRWNLRNKNRDFECDLIIAGLDLGILVLEIKGGLWERKAGNWYANDHLVTGKGDPVEQVITIKHGLIDLLRSKPEWNRGYFPVQHALIFPDTPSNEENLCEDLPHICGTYELRTPEMWIDVVMKECLQKSAPAVCNGKMLDHLTRMLMKDYTVHLSEILDHHDNQLAILTDQQLQLDRYLNKKKQFIVQGCAGAGKTIMALRQTKRLAKSASVKKILLTCFNHELADWLHTETESIRNKCDCDAFLRFFDKHATENGLIELFEPRKNSEYYQRLTDLLLDVIDAANLEYDAIIIDEAQQFRPEWWDIIPYLTRNSSSQGLFIFFDNEQRIYQETSYSIPGEDEAFELTINLRNTTSIHQQATRFINDKDYSENNNIQGEPVEYLDYDGISEMRKKLRKILHKLIVQGRVSVKDIIILTGRVKSTSDFKKLIDENNIIGSYQIIEDETDRQNCIRYTSIHKYRGLERKVVILTDIHYKDYAEMNYLGASRAKVKLYLLIPSDSIISQPELIKSCKPFD